MPEHGNYGQIRWPIPLNEISQGPQQIGIFGYDKSLQSPAVQGTKDLGLRREAQRAEVRNHEDVGWTIPLFSENLGTEPLSKYIRNPCWLYMRFSATWNRLFFYTAYWAYCCIIFVQMTLLSTLLALLNLALLSLALPSLASLSLTCPSLSWLDLQFAWGSFAWGSFA